MKKIIIIKSYEPKFSGLSYNKRKKLMTKKNEFKMLKSYKNVNLVKVNLHAWFKITYIMYIYKWWIKFKCFEHR